MDIVEELRKDPEKGARRLEAEYKAGLMSLALRFCNDPGDAEELVNSTFAEVVDGIDDYIEQSAFFGWMCQILTSKFAKSIRRKSNRMETFPGDLPEPEDPEAGENIYRHLDASLLRDAVESLPPDFKKTVVMHYFMDVPVGEIAKVLSISSGTVKWRLHHARLALASKLGAAAKKPRGRVLLLALALAGATALGAGVVRLATRGSEPSAQTAAETAGAGGTGETSAVPSVPSVPSVSSVPSDPSVPSVPSVPSLSALPSSTATATTPQKTTTMKTRTLLAATLGAALATTAPANASSRIEESDLLGGKLPDALVFEKDFGPIQRVGSSYNVSAFFDASAISMFDIRGTSGNTAWYLDVAITNSFFFNTYSINVNRGTSQSGNNRAPKSWEVYGSTTTSDASGPWQLLTSESGQTDWDLVNGETRHYRFRNTGTKWKRLRFKFLETNGDKSYIHVSAIMIYPATSLATGATEETFAGCADLVPAPASGTQSRYTSTSGTPFTTASLSNPGLPFAAGEPSRMVFNYRDGDDAAVNVIYEFGRETPEVVNGYLVWMANNQYSGTGNAPRSWTFSGSGDGESWTVLDERAEQYGWALGQKRWYSFENHDAYAFYKIEFTGSNGGTRIEIGSLDYYHRQIEGVYFARPSVEVAGGSFVVSGALAPDSMAADVTVRAATNGIPFAVPLGAKRPGEAFSAAIPGPGVLYASLAGIAEGFTNVVSAGVAHVAGAAPARFVSPDGDDGDAGDSPASPMRHVAAAVAALGSAGGTVAVLPGAYAETNDLSAVTLAAPVAVFGVTGDPADATVTASGAPCGYARVFRLAHASALVRALTIRDGHVLNEPSAGQTAAEANAALAAGTAANGGNVWIESAGGTVENCVIRDGTVDRFSTAGGNVYLQGGRLSRCVLAGGKLSTNLDLVEKRPCGTSLYARGGLVESCLFTDTVQSVAPICVEGSARLLNCTVAGNKGKFAGGVVVKTAAATVANTVICGNRATEEGGNAVWLPIPGIDEAAAAARFTACATDGSAAINETCIRVDDTAFADASAGNWAPAAFESPLVNRGAEYAAAGGVSACDLAGNPRVCKRRVDIGAFEFQYADDPPFVLVVR